jgi:penicillin-binding protein 1C
MRLPLLGLGLALGVPALAVSLTLVILPPLDTSRYQNRSPVVTARDGEILNVFLAEDERWRLHTTPAMVSSRFIDSLLAIEDQYFFHHPGVNPLALLRAATQWVRHGRIVSGGSTLTMQVARLLEPRPRTLRSKWIEIVRALQLEWLYSKDEILTMYLTLLPMGGNLESLRAASYRYLDADPMQLSLAEVAVLLAIPQSPERRRPDRNEIQTREAAKGKARYLIERGLFAPQDSDEIDRLVFGERGSFPNHAWHLSNRLVRQYQERAVSEIRSTIDYRIQLKLEDKAEALRGQLGRQQNLAAVVLNAVNGEVLAHIGSLGLDSEAGFLDLTEAVRSPGSALKPFIYGMAMDDGLITDQTILLDRPRRFGEYAPSNFEGGHRGPVRAGTALQASLNVPAVEVLEQLGATLFLNAWELAGLHYTLPADASPSVAVALGAVGVRLSDLVRAYAALAHEGRVPSIRTQLTEVTDPRTRSLLTPESAQRLTSILASAPMVDGRLHRASTTARSIPAFKTGTSYGYRDAWAIGTTGQFAVGVWIGRPDGVPVTGITGRALALRLALDIADQLPGDFRPAAWRALPIGNSEHQLHQPPQAIRPEPGADLLLHEPPHPERMIELQLSARNETTTVYVNGMRLEHLDAIPVPHNGSYRVELFDAHSRIQVFEFSVMGLAY